MNLMVQENRLKSEIAAIEKDTGLKLRLLCQNYPQTPGMLPAARQPISSCRAC